LYTPAIKLRDFNKPARNKFYQKIPIFIGEFTKIGYKATTPAIVPSLGDNPGTLFLIPFFTTEEVKQ
jgi:hypothetical protein